MIGYTRREFVGKTLALAAGAGLIGYLGNQEAMASPPSSKEQAKYFEEQLERVFSDKNRVLAKKPEHVSERLEGFEGILRRLEGGRGYRRFETSKILCDAIHSYAVKSGMDINFDLIVGRAMQEYDSKGRKQDAKRLRKHWEPTQEFLGKYKELVHGAKGRDKGSIAGYKVVELLMGMVQRKGYIDLEKAVGELPKVDEWVCPAFVVRYGSSDKEASEVEKAYDKPEVLDSYFNFFQGLRGKGKRPSKKWVNAVKKTALYKKKRDGFRDEVVSVDKKRKREFFFGGRVIRDAISVGEYEDLKKEHEDLPELDPGLTHAVQDIISGNVANWRKFPAMNLSWFNQVYREEERGRVRRKIFGHKVLKYAAGKEARERGLKEGRIKLRPLSAVGREAVFGLIDGRRFINGNGEERPPLPFFDTQHAVSYIGEVEADRSVLGPYGAHTAGTNLVFKVKPLRVGAATPKDDPRKEGKKKVDLRFLIPFVDYLNSLTQVGYGYVKKEQAELRFKVDGRIASRPRLVGGGFVNTGPIEKIYPVLEKRLEKYYESRAEEESSSQEEQK